MGLPMIHARNLKHEAPNGSHHSHCHENFQENSFALRKTCWGKFTTKDCTKQVGTKLAEL